MTIKNPKKLRLYMRDYYASHEEYRDYMAKKSKAWAKAFPERRREIARRSYHKNKKVDN